MDFLSLPSDILTKVMQTLPVRDAANLMQTCRHLAAAGRRPMRQNMMNKLQKHLQWRPTVTLDTSDRAYNKYTMKLPVRGGDGGWLAFEVVHWVIFEDDAINTTKVTRWLSRYKTTYCATCHANYKVGRDEYHVGPRPGYSHWNNNATPTTNSVEKTELKRRPTFFLNCLLVSTIVICHGLFPEL